MLACAGLLLCLACLLHASSPAPDRYASRALPAAEADLIPLQQGEIDVNRGDAAELDALPGVGEVLAQAIIDERELHGPFFYPEDLLQVYGIGTSKLSNMRELLHLEGVEQ